PKCARCKSPLLRGAPVTLDAQSFAKHADDSDFPVLVDFWAPWCGPCLMMAPVLDRLASEWQTRVQVGKLNTDEHQELAAKFGIRSIPTLILLRGGKELARRSGAMEFSSLTRWLDSVIPQSR